MSEVLHVISRSAFDLQAVFETLTESAARLCEAEMATIARQEGDAYYYATAYGFQNEVNEYLKSVPLTPDRGSAIGRSIVEGKIVQIPDVLADPEYIMLEMQQKAGFRTVLAVPLLREGRPIGVIGLLRSEVRPFTDNQIALVMTFAAQAMIAIENTRLLNDLRQRTNDLTEALERQTATSEVLHVISASPGDLEPVFRTMLQNAVQICKAKAGNIYRWENDGLQLVASHNAPAPFVEMLRRTPVRATANNPVGRMLATKSLIHTADLAVQQPYLQRSDPAMVAAVDLGGVRTQLSVPLLKENEFIGAITLWRSEVRPFDDKQISLVQNFAAQAVIAIENARLLTELRQRTSELGEALEQQTATSEVLRVISSSPGELEPVFQAMLENAVRICGAKFGNLVLHDGEGLRIGATYGAPPAYVDFLRGEDAFKDLSPEVGVGRLMRTKECYQVTDLAAAPTLGDKLREATIELAGARTLIGVPMLKDGEAVGAIIIYRQEVKPFTDKQIALLQNFAAQAVIAIENARLLNELRQRTDQLDRSVGELRALGEVSHAVNSTLELEKVLATIVAKAVELSGTEAGAIYGYDEWTQEFRLRATHGMDRDLIDALRQHHIGFDEPSVGLAFARREPVQVADLKEEPRSEINNVILRAGYRARLLAPLLRGDNVAGMLVVRRKAPGRFEQNTIDLIKTFAAQSALAIQNAKLFDNVETQTRELAKSLEDLRSAQDRLVQTQKLASLGQLTAGIAHEIKNPLNFVNNFSGVSVELIDELQETLKTEDFDSKALATISDIADTLRGNLDKIIQHGKRADSIVKNMLMHSREGSGEHRLVDINALVEESLNLAYHGARAEKQGFNITLERSFDPAAGKADIYPQEITQSFSM